MAAEVPVHARALHADGRAEVEGGPLGPGSSTVRAALVARDGQDRGDLE